MIDPLRRWALQGIVGLGVAVSLGLDPGTALGTRTTTDTGAGLPVVLDPEDRERYRRIFALQRDGRLDDAARHIAALRNPILMGHVIAQKLMHPTAHRSSYAELRAWLDEYADHPDATRIHKLALKRMPEGARPPRAPQVTAAGRLGIDESAPRIKLPTRSLSDEKRARLKTLHRRMRGRIGRGWPTGAREVLESDEYRALASEAQYDASATRIAWSYFRHDKDVLALSMASDAAARSSDLVPDAHWTGGLAAWRLGRMDDARRHFETLARAPKASRWLRAGGAYWAARANLRAGRPEAVSPWLRRAAALPRTFYGLLAVRALGTGAGLNFTRPPLGDADGRTIASTAAVRRALALAEVGQGDRAKKEIQLHYVHASAEEIDALLAVATQLDLPEVQMGLARRIYDVSGRRDDMGAYPLPGWEPVGGFSIDRALVFSIIRQESGFRTGARSGRGAAGVMQLMPATARFAARRAGLGRVSSRSLRKPEVNMALGQSYLNHLLELQAVDGNLFYLLAAYNAGPGTLGKWRSATNYDGDPLLFIESIGSRETRFFIERVLTFYWIYRMRLGQDTPSLDAVASGGWPRYVAQDP